MRLGQRRKSSNVIELKAGAFTLPVLRLLQYRPDEILQALADKARQAPEMFRNAPVAIDVSALEEDIDISGFENLIRIIGGLGIHALGIQGGSMAQQAAARAAGLAVLSESRAAVKPSRSKDSATANPVEDPIEQTQKSVEAVAPVERATSTLVERPVRSGQRVYAANGDLIVLATVSAGAEIIAEGNIHVYGTLRGRALAGVKGDLNARIFCTDLQAELVSISGQYQISEGIDHSLHGKAAQIYLSGESLFIEML